MEAVVLQEQDWIPNFVSLNIPFDSQIRITFLQETVDVIDAVKPIVVEAEDGFIISQIVNWVDAVIAQSGRQFDESGDFFSGTM